jgi:hypothetical protein
VAKKKSFITLIAGHVDDDDGGQVEDDEEHSVAGVHQRKVEKHDAYHSKGKMGVTFPKSDFTCFLSKTPNTREGSFPFAIVIKIANFLINCEVL